MQNINSSCINMRLLLLLENIFFIIYLCLSAKTAGHIVPKFYESKCLWRRMGVGEGTSWNRYNPSWIFKTWCSHSCYWLHWMQFLKMLNFRIYGQWHWLHLKFSWIFFLWSRPHPNVMIYYKIVYHVIAQPLAKSHKIFSRWIADVS